MSNAKWRRALDSRWTWVVVMSAGLLGVLPYVLQKLCWTQNLSEGIYIGTGIAVIWYTVETYYLRRETAQGVKNAWSANQAGLLRQILQEHADLAEDRDIIQGWWRAYPATAITRYEAELRSRGHPNVHEARRRVSQYFLRLRTLCEKEMIDPDLIARTLGDEAIQVFVLYIDPLDEAVRRVAGKQHKTAEREYFQGYLHRFFPDSANEDPWGFRLGPGSTA